MRPHLAMRKGHCQAANDSKILQCHHALQRVGELAVEEQDGCGGKHNQQNRGQPHHEAKRKAKSRNQLEEADRNSQSAGQPGRCYHRLGPGNVGEFAHPGYDENQSEQYSPDNCRDLRHGRPLQSSC